MQRTLLALALILTASAAYAQSMPTNEPTDPYGRPLIGRNDWVRQPGDERRPRRHGEPEHGGGSDGAGASDAHAHRPASGRLQGRVRLPL